MRSPDDQENGMDSSEISPEFPRSGR